MPMILEERVAYLEGRVEEHSYAWQDLREKIIHLEQTLDRRFEAIDRRFEAMEQRFSKYFLWTIGIQVSVLLAVIASLLK